MDTVHRIGPVVGEMAMGTEGEQGSPLAPSPRQRVMVFDPKLQWDADVAAFRGAMMRARKALPRGGDVHAWALQIKKSSGHISEAENGIKGRSFNHIEIARYLQEPEALDELLRFFCHRAGREFPEPLKKMTPEQAKDRFHEKVKMKYGALADEVKREIAEEDGVSPSEVPL